MDIFLSMFEHVQVQASCMKEHGKGAVNNCHKAVCMTSRKCLHMMISRLWLLLAMIIYVLLVDPLPNILFSRLLRGNLLLMSDIGLCLAYQRNFGQCRHQCICSWKHRAPSIPFQFKYGNALGMCFILTTHKLSHHVCVVPEEAGSLFGFMRNEIHVNPSYLVVLIFMDLAHVVYCFIAPCMGVFAGC